MPNPLQARLNENTERPHPFGVTMIDAFRGPATQAAAFALIPTPGTLRGTLAKQPTATGVTGARFQNATFKANAEGNAANVFCEYLEIRPKS